MANDQKSVFKQKRLNTRLLEAVRNRNLENVKSLLINGANPDARCRVSHVSVCHLAAYYGHSGILEELLDRDADLSARDIEGFQPHHLAAYGYKRDGSLQCLRTILDKQNNLLNSPVKQPKSETTLEDAVLDSFDHNHNHTLNLVTGQFEEGSTALYIAVRKGNTDAVEELLKRKATISKETRTAASEHRGGEIYILVDTALSQRPSMQPLQLAILKGNTKEVEEGLRSLDDRGQLGPMSLHLAVQNDLKNPSNKDNYNIILQMLLEKSSSDINTKDEHDKTSLYLAIEGKWMDDVDVLLEHGADIRVKCKDNETVIHAVARSSDCDLLKYLLESQPDRDVLTVKDNEGYTPLYRAIKAGCVNCVKILLESGSVDHKIEVRDSEGGNYTFTLVHAAIESNKENDKMLQKVMEYVAKSRLNVINEPNSKGMTPVDLAAKLGSARCLDILFGYNTDSNTILFNIAKKDTPLHYAAKHGHKLCLEKILNKYEELINMPDSKGITALMYATRGGYWRCAELLIKRGANVAAKDPSLNRTVIDIMMSKLPNAVEMIEGLLDSFIGLEKEEQLTEVKTDVSPGKSKQHKNNRKRQYLLLPTNMDDNVIHNDQEDQVKLDYTCLVAGTRQLEVIEAVSDCNYDRLKKQFFLHPLVQTFLLFKWKQSNKIFNFLLFIYCIHIASITGLALCTFVYPFPTIGNICRGVILVTILPVILMEIISWLLNAKIFSRSETCLKWLAILMTGLMSVMPIFDWNRYMASLTVLLAWIELLLFYSMSRKGSFYILLLFKVASNVFRVMSSFLFLIVGFALAFLILFNGKPPFRNPLSAFGEVLAMMSDLNYNDAFENDTDDDLLFKIIGPVLYIVFYFLTVMVMMNLIIGLSVNVVTEHEGQSKHLAMQGSFLSLVDVFCYSDEAHRFIIWLREILGNQIAKNSPHQPIRCNILQDELKFAIMDIINNRNRRDRPERIIDNFKSLIGDLNDVAQSILMKSNNRS